MSSKVEFVSYDGKYPNLCRGSLVFKVNGVEYSTKELNQNGNAYVYLESGGSTYFTNNYNEDHVEHGPWSIGGLPPELEHIQEELERLINENVSQGCCGGCL